MSSEMRPKSFGSFEKRAPGDRKILPAPGTNQIAGFSGYRPLTIKEINMSKNQKKKRNNIKLSQSPFKIFSRAGKELQ